MDESEGSASKVEQLSLVSGCCSFPLIFEFSVSADRDVYYRLL